MYKLIIDKKLTCLSTGFFTKNFIKIIKKLTGIFQIFVIQIRSLLRNSHPTGARFPSMKLSDITPCLGSEMEIAKLSTSLSLSAFNDIAFFVLLSLILFLFW